MATTADIRKGLCIKHSSDLYKIIDFQHVKPGKGPAFVRTKLKSLSSGKVIDNTFSAGHKIDVVRVENRKYQYMYNDESGYHFMNSDTYDQIFLDKNMLDCPELLKEGEIVEIVFDAEKEKPISCDMPQNVYLEITYTEHGTKGNTATNATKQATVETGAIIQVPLFIEIGDRIKIDTASKSYLERVKAQ